MKFLQSLLLIALCAAPAAAAEPTPADVSGLSLEPGLSLRAYDVGEDMSRLPDLVAGQTGNVNKLIQRIDLRDQDFGLDDKFLTVISGWLVVDAPGEYTFEMFNDDGAELSIGGTSVVVNDGFNEGKVAASGSAELAAGTYAFLLRHFDQANDARLLLRWKPPGATDFAVVPRSAFRTEADQVRVTAPGKKQVELLDGDGRLRGRDPGDRAPLTAVHPALELVTIRPDSFEPRVGGIDFLRDGRLVLCTWDPDGDVYILDDVTGENVDPAKVRITKFATGLAEPLGVKVMDGRIFVLQKQELTELIDRDGDGTADEYRAAVTGWPVTANFHEFAFGLAEKNSKLYANLAVAINPGGATTEQQVIGRGTCIELDPESGTYRTVAAGLRTPNGIGTGVDGELFIADNQGAWLPASKLIHVEQDAFYNEYLNPPHPLSGNPVTPPAVWLPQGEIGNSPSNSLMVPAGWGPYVGQMLHGDVTHGGVKRVFMEKIEGQYQGCAFRFTQGLEAGVNRIAVGPDGDLYAGGIGSNGNWGQEGKLRFGLQKLHWTGGVPFEMLAVRPNRDGLDIEFTKPLASGSGESADDYRIEQWYYEPTEEYGGPKMGEQTLAVKSVSLSPDRTKAFLEVDGMNTGHVVYVLLRGVTGEGGEKPWSTEAWYTLNRIPQRTVAYASPTTTVRADADADEADFETLFNGTLDSARGHWRAFKGINLPAGWQVEDGALKRAGGGAGDIISRQTFGDFDLRFEWKVGDGGNSGVFYRVAEEGDNTGAVWTTGPEYQIIDDQRHADAEDEDRRAGTMYELYQRLDSSTYKPAGQWNTGRIVVRGGRVEHYLNGVKVVDAVIGSDDWDAKIKASKFGSMARFGTEKVGHLALQDHGDAVWFRDIRVKRLDDPKGEAQMKDVAE